MERPDGTLATTTDEIAEVMRNYYVDLYTAEPVNGQSQDKILRDIRKRLTSQQRNSIDGKLTHKELGEAAKALNNGKSPGSDGIPAEFYKKFWTLIGNDLSQVANHAYDTGILTNSQNEALIKCLFKKATGRKWQIGDLSAY